jgi:hypothetical protein
MKTKVAVIQSNYIPWKGYFDIIHDVDAFIFYDDVQFTKNDWRNRNKIKTPRGAEWITIPVGTDLRRLICEVELGDSSWQQKHFNLLRMHYERSPHFETYRPLLEQVLLERTWTNLSELNHFLIRSIARDCLGINTEFLDSRAFNAQGQKLDRLVDLLKKAGADVYMSGPAARDYIDASVFESAGIELVYKSYAGYPEYAQAHAPFEHGVSILDLLFNMGPRSPEFIWGWRERKEP